MYLRLRELRAKGHVDSNEEGRTHDWYLTEQGQKTLAEFEFPPAEETDFEEYFAGRSMELRPNLVLERLC